MQPQSSTPSTLERNLLVSVSTADVETQVAQRLKSIARTAKMSGFRPGKVPFGIVAKQYGPQVRQEVVSDSLQRSFSEAVQQQQLRVVSVPRFAPSNNAAADKVEFTATFEVYPEIKIGSLTGKPLERPQVTIADTDVDNTLTTLRKQRATFELADRAAEKGDFLVIDFVGKMNGEAFQGGSAENFGVVLGEGRLLPDFEAALIGMSPAAEKTFDLAFPADYNNQELAGKTAQFTVTVKTVNAPKLPELDAAFAMTLGVADGNLDKMRAEIRDNLQRELKKRLQARAKDQVMEALASVSELDLPRSLVEAEVGRLHEQALRDLDARGMTTKNMQLPPELFLERAEKRVRYGLILSEVVSRNSLKATPEQVRALVEEHAQSFEDPPQMVRWYFSDPDRLAEVEGMVLEDNVVEWAAASMTVTMPVMGFDEVMGIKR